MNSLERVRRVLAGGIRIVFRCACIISCWPPTKLASAWRLSGQPEAIARVHIQAVEKYGHDCIMVDTDTTMLAEAMGAQSECAPNEPGRIVEPAIRSLDEVDRLKVINRRLMAAFRHS